MEKFRDGKSRPRWGSRSTRIPKTSVQLSVLDVTLIITMHMHVFAFEGSHLVPKQTKKENSAPFKMRPGFLIGRYHLLGRVRPSNSSFHCIHSRGVPVGAIKG